MENLLLLNIIDFLENTRFLGIKLLNYEDFLELVVRFFMNLLVVFIIVRLIYFPHHKVKEHLFVLFVFNATVFFICYLMGNLNISVGFGFGLFALFALLRFRSDPIPIRVMTYLFVVIGIAVINALVTKKISYFELIFTNFALIGFTYILERVWAFSNELSKKITYEKIELIKPEHRAELIKDLKERTGLNIHRVEVDRINLLRDTANLIIYYKEDENNQS